MIELEPWQKFVAQLRERKDPLCDQAANEIESLRKQIDDLNEDWQTRMADCCESAADHYSRGELE